MRLASCKTPQERDLEIYHKVSVDHWPQTEVAKLFGVTQSRVSQICKRVQLWHVLNVQEDELGLVQRNYLNIRDSRVRIEAKLRKAAEVFEDSLRDEVLKSKKQKGTGEILAEEKVKKGKPNHQLFRQLCDLESQLLAIQTRENEAEIEVVKANRQYGLWREEELTRLGLRRCRELVHYYPQAIRFGLKLDPLPEFDPKQIEAQLRARYRQLVLEKKEPKLRDVLPADWMRAHDQLASAYEPFRELVGEDASTSDSAGATPASPPVDVAALQAESAEYKRLYEQEVACNKQLTACLRLSDERVMAAEKALEKSQQKVEILANNANTRRDVPRSVAAENRPQAERVPRNNWSLSRRRPNSS